MPKKTGALLKDQKLTALLLAQSAQLQGHQALASQEYRALLEDEETAFLGLRGLAMQALRQGKTTEALRHVRAAQALKPNAPWVIDLLYHLELAEGNLINSAEAVKKTARLNDLISRDTAGTRLAPLYTAAGTDAMARDQDQKALRLSGLALDQTPTYMAAVLTRVRALLRAQKLKQARALIQKIWRHKTQPDLLPLYLEASNVGDNPKARRKSLLNLIKTNRGQDGQLALGNFTYPNWI